MPVDVETVSTVCGCGLQVGVVLELVLVFQCWVLCGLTATATVILPVIHIVESDVVYWKQLRGESQPVWIRPTLAQASDIHTGCVHTNPFSCWASSSSLEHTHGESTVLQ